MKKKQAWKVMGAVLAGTLVFSDAVPLRASASAGTEKSAVQNETVSGTENGIPVCLVPFGRLWRRFQQKGQGRRACQNPSPASGR